MWHIIWGFLKKNLLVFLNILCHLPKLLALVNPYLLPVWKCQPGQAGGHLTECSDKWRLVQSSLLVICWLSITHWWTLIPPFTGGLYFFIHPEVIEVIQVQSSLPKLICWSRDSKHNKNCPRRGRWACWGYLEPGTHGTERVWAWHLNSLGRVWTPSASTGRPPPMSMLGPVAPT